MRPKLHNVFITSFDVGGSAESEESFIFKTAEPTGGVGSRSEDDDLRIATGASRGEDSDRKTDLRDTPAEDHGLMMFESAVLDFQLTGDDSF
ncbi:hypothetical protein [Falsiphaeobacter marinintestinus]|uniref:hypothetical protein n=1 Tax=Falsiphaeobacter marinintestinus TaxID=1492905 RepID=UPI0011B62DB6|nr:hypothetical protein [Phaeobacter marinintestinus]